MKKLAMGVAGLLSGLFVLALPFIFIFGLTRVSEIIFPWLAPAFSWTLLISVFVFGPLAVIRRTRGFSAAGLMVASYIFGACLWFSSLFLTNEHWGTVAVFIGLFVLGIGIVPIALLATLFHGHWQGLLDLLILIVATIGSRLLAVWLAEKVDAERYAEPGSQSDHSPQAKQRDWMVPLGIFGTLALLIFVFGHRAPSNANLSAAEVFSQTAGSVVRIQVSRQDDSKIVGSGFVAVLENHPYVVTNRHVLENADYVKVGAREDSMFNVQNYWVPESVDLALLEIPDKLQLRPLPLRRTAVQPGEIAYVIGFPLGLAESITQGLVTAIYADALQFDAPISSGNSGGPVLDAHAEVIGVAALGSKSNTEQILQNLNIAIPVTNFPPLTSFRLSSHLPGSTPEATPIIPSPETPSPLFPAPTLHPMPEVRRGLPPQAELPEANSTPLLPALPNVTPAPVPELRTPVPNYNDVQWPDGRMLIHSEALRCVTGSCARPYWVLARVKRSAFGTPGCRRPPPPSSQAPFRCLSADIGRL